MSNEQKKGLYCNHLKEAQKAVEIKEYADKKLVKIENLEKIVNSQGDLKVLNEFSSSGTITVYVLPGDNIVVPSFTTESYESPVSLLHVREGFKKGNTLLFFKTGGMETRNSIVKLV